MNGIRSTTRRINQQCPTCNYCLLYCILHLPPHLAAVMRTTITVKSMNVEAALTGKREHVYQAAAFDPHTAVESSLDQIWNLCDDLLAAHGNMIPTLK